MMKNVAILSTQEKRNKTEMIDYYISGSVSSTVVARARVNEHLLW